jgi:ATP-binding cassette subfamily C (CFTR/MRP) protein 1
MPMNTLIQTVPNLNGAMACFKRISSFLSSDVRRDHRLPLDTPDFISDSTGSLTTSVGLNTLRPASIMDAPMIDAQGVSFSWSTDADPVIRDVSFNIQRGHLCFLIGPIGCGKSTLLKGLLGETPSSEGFIYSSARGIAFVDQTPWVRSGTIKQNILGVSVFDESWYKQVVHSCALTADIALLPRGHGKFFLHLSIDLF